MNFWFVDENGYDSYSDFYLFYEADKLILITEPHAHPDKAVGEFYLADPKCVRKILDIVEEIIRDLKDTKAYGWKLN